MVSILPSQERRMTFCVPLLVLHSVRTGGRKTPQDAPPWNQDPSRELAPAAGRLVKMRADRSEPKTHPACKGRAVQPASSKGQLTDSQRWLILGKVGCMHQHTERELHWRFKKHRNQLFFFFSLSLHATPEKSFYIQKTQKFKFTCVNAMQNIFFFLWLVFLRMKRNLSLKSGPKGQKSKNVHRNERIRTAHLERNEIFWLRTLTPNSPRS